MAVAIPVVDQPRLVFFHSALSGQCRRVEGFLAQVLQRRRNHGTFKVVREKQPVSARGAAKALNADKDAIRARLRRLAASGAVKETPEGWVTD